MKLRSRPSSHAGDGVRAWGGQSADVSTNHPSSRTNADSGLVMEQDFTIPGTPSKLHCPFMPPNGRKLSSHALSVFEKHSLPTPRSSISRPSGQARRSKRPSFNDPIRAELCGNDPTSAAPSIEGSAPVCPIRFLDQHTPEEVAKYFEEHKHELPRSHEVCVKRYQSNAESIRQLDAKYGNLVSMIQGLGHKHQPLLPDKPELDEDEREEEDGQGGRDRVNKWAKAVSECMDDDGPVVTDSAEGQDERLPHFDRPLKEIRVGESPSRPWGITVPARYAEAGSASSAKSAKTASPVDKTRAETRRQDQPAKCPFDHGALKKPPAKQQPSELKPPQDQTIQAEQERLQMNTAPVVVNAPTVPLEAGEATKSLPRMMFTGPVFIGYPMEQALALLQQSGLGTKT